MSFSSLGLHPLLLKTIETAGYNDPTPVQAQAIPAAIAGADLLVSSHTGSGKTAAFLLPSIQRLLEPSASQGNGPRVLVLTPTRELAQQVEKAAETYGRALRRLRTVSLVGGMPYPQQLRMLRDPIDIVVATPGRLIDHLERGRIDFSRLEVLILDEADRMLDMGFIDDIQMIVARTPENRQTMLFSATLDGVVGKLAQQLTNKPQRIEIAPPPAREAKIDQRMLLADNIGHKNRLLDFILRDVEMQQAVVFMATKRSADELSGNLREQGFAAEALHGDMHQNQRNRTLDRLRNGRTQILVATDVAARGIDVAGISHVINFDLPKQAEDYVHRIGRTARAGRSGIAITMVGHSEKRMVRDIERYTGQSITFHTLPGLEPTDRPARSAPRPGGDRRPGGGGRSFSGRPSGGGGYNSGAPRQDREFSNSAPRRFESSAPRSEQRDYSNAAPRRFENNGPRVDQQYANASRRPEHDAPRAEYRDSAPRRSEGHGPRPEFRDRSAAPYRSEGNGPRVEFRDRSSAAPRRPEGAAGPRIEFRDRSAAPRAEGSGPRVEYRTRSEGNAPRSEPREFSSAPRRPEGAKPFHKGPPRGGNEGGNRPFSRPSKPATRD